jgi:hypothetical protein
VTPVPTKSRTANENAESWLARSDRYDRVRDAVVSRNEAEQRMGTASEIPKALRMKPPKTKTRIPEISVSGVIGRQTESATRLSY